MNDRPIREWFFEWMRDTMDATDWPWWPSTKTKVGFRFYVHLLKSMEEAGFTHADATRVTNFLRNRPDPGRDRFIQEVLDCHTYGRYGNIDQLADDVASSLARTARHTMALAIDEKIRQATDRQILVLQHLLDATTEDGSLYEMFWECERLKGEAHAYRREAESHAAEMERVAAFAMQFLAGFKAIRTMLEIPAVLSTAKEEFASFLRDNGVPHQHVIDATRALGAKLRVLQHMQIPEEDDFRTEGPGETT